MGQNYRISVTSTLLGHLPHTPTIYPSAPPSLSPTLNFFTRFQVLHTSCSNHHHTTYPPSTSGPTLSLHSLTHLVPNLHWLHIDVGTSCQVLLQNTVLQSASLRGKHNQQNPVQRCPKGVGPAMVNISYVPSPTKPDCHTTRHTMFWGSW